MRAGISAPSGRGKAIRKRSPFSTRSAICTRGMGTGREILLLITVERPELFSLLKQMPELAKFAEQNIDFCVI